MSEKTVVITGASSGIGAALAAHLGRLGHRLVLAARRGQQIREIAAGIGPQAFPVVCDVTHVHEVTRLRDTALTTFGHVDVWVNNVGRGINRPVLELTESDLDEMITVNLKSALYCIQAIIPHFQQRGKGHMINVSSFLGRVPMVTNRSAYSAAKAALNTLTANLRADLANTWPEIHVSLVMPGVVLTDFAKNALGATPQTSIPSSATSPQTAEQVAEVIANVIAKPQAEVYTNPASHNIVRRYYDNVGAFEEAARPKV